MISEKTSKPTKELCANVIDIKYFYYRILTNKILIN